MIIEKLTNQIKKALKSLGLPEEKFVVEHPTDESHGDYSTNVAMITWPKIRKISKEKPEWFDPDKLNTLIYQNPRELAESIMGELQKNKIEYVEKIEIAGPGFINFYLSDQFLLSEISTVLDLGEKYGTNETRSGKRIMVEYAHPNTHKQFHIGHLRNIATGESLTRILEASGAQVIRVNYQGDVGLHIAKAIWGILDNKEEYEKVSKQDILKKVEFLGKSYAHGSSAYESSDEAKEQIQEYNKQIFLGEGDIISLWKETRQWSLDYFDIIYKRVGTKYDRLYFESECMDGVDIAKDALKKGILKESDGAIVFDGSEYGLDTRVFVNSMGLPTYEAKELSLAPKEFSEFGNLNRCIHVVGPEQKSFFSVTFKVEELLDPDMFADKQMHYVYEYVNLKSGKMSSREGSVVTGWWVIEEAKKRISKLLSANDKYSSEEKEKISEEVAVGAVKYAFLKSSPKMTISFDFDESLSFEGNSGPYVQYTYTRGKSVIEKAGDIMKGESFDDYEMNPEEKSVASWMYRYPEIVSRSSEELAPHHLVHYVYELASRFNGFYSKHSVLSADTDTQKQFRLALTASVVQIISNSLSILGIPIPEKM